LARISTPVPSSDSKQRPDVRCRLAEGQSTRNCVQASMSSTPKTSVSGPMMFMMTVARWVRSAALLRRIGTGI
jgi:hypothetical protein